MKIGTRVTAKPMVGTSLDGSKKFCLFCYGIFFRLYLKFVCFSIFQYEGTYLYGF